MNDSSKLVLALLALGGVFGFIYFISRPSMSAQPASSQRVSLRPVGQDKVARQYSNSETWDIKYDDDGLPVKVTISRKATEI